MTIVALYPDLHGNGLQPGGVAEQLMARYPIVVAILNGNTQTVRNPRRRGLHVLRSPHPSLAGSLPYGYEYARDLGDVVLRLDTNEHPSDAAEMVAEQARRHGGAVGDPFYLPGTLTPHTPDELAQLDVFPMLFHHVTHGALQLTGSHGLQAWSSEALDRVLPVAQSLFATASGAEPLPWGFDAAMVLAAPLVNVSPKVVPYPAPSLRDRDRERIASQFDCVLRVCLAYMRATHGDFLPNETPTAENKRSGQPAERSRP